MTDPIRVLVVEDSVTIRRRLVAVLGDAPDIQVVGEAQDGKEAIELCLALRPDVITMDMVLPVMSGLAATEYIMAHRPTPILVVSSSFNRGEVFKTYEALAAGAVDAIEKPTGEEPPGVWESAFLGSLRIVARVRVITHPRARLSRRVDRAASAERPVEPLSGRLEETTMRPAVVAIGASTGGPAAVVRILRDVPAPCAVPILVVLHIGAPFARDFAEWLDGQTAHRVRYAVDGERLTALSGSVRLAPADRHLVVRGGVLRLTEDPERFSCRPSVDVLFESLASERGDATVACLLTGMGRDGAAGLLRLRKAGALTIAQDEASSVVYGMPREAVQLGAAERVLPLSEIGPAIADCLVVQRSVPA